MIDIFLYVMLGFLAAGCLALAGGRLLWSRAVRLTTRRLESQLPSSVGEIVAAQDMIRAEGAIRIRALERAVSSLRAKLVVAEAAAASSDTERTRYALEHSEKATIIAAMETRIAALEEQLSEAQGSGAEAVENRDRAREEFAALRKKLDADSRALAEARVELDAQKVRFLAMEAEASQSKSDHEDTRRDLAAAQNRYEETNSKLTAALSRCEELSAEIKLAKAEAAETFSALSDLRKEHERQAAELSEIRKTLAHATARAEALKADLADRAARETETAAAQEALQRRLVETETALKASDERQIRDAKRADRLAKELEDARQSQSDWEERARKAEADHAEQSQQGPAVARAQADAEKRAATEQARALRLAEELKELELKAQARSEAYESETRRLQAALEKVTAEHARAAAAETRAVQRIKILSQDLLAAQSGTDDGSSSVQDALAKVRAEKTALESQLSSAKAEWAKVERQLQRSVGPASGQNDSNAHLLRTRLDMLADEIALFAGADLPPVSGLVTPLHPRNDATMHVLAQGADAARARDTAGAAG